MILKKSKLIKILMLLSLVFTIGACKATCSKEIKSDPPSAKTETKFEHVAKWIPASSDIVLVIDAYQLTHSDIWDTLQYAVKRKVDQGWLKDIISSPNLNYKSQIGMIIGLLQFKNIKKKRPPLYIIDGSFHQNLYISRIRESLRKKGEHLQEENYKDMKIFHEVDKNNKSTSYSLAVLESGTIAVGYIDDIKWIIDSKDESNPIFFKNRVDISKPIWATLKNNSILEKEIPLPWKSIESAYLLIDFNEKIDLELILISDIKSAQSIQTHLKGLIALKAIETYNDKKLIKAIKDLSIMSEKNKTKIKLSVDKENLKDIILNLKDTNSDRGNSDYEKSE